MKKLMTKKLLKSTLIYLTGVALGAFLMLNFLASTDRNYINSLSHAYRLGCVEESGGIRSCGKRAFDYSMQMALLIDSEVQARQY